MKTLIIIAHPKTESLSFALSDKYKELALAKNHTVEIIDLYRCQYKQDYFTYQDISTLKTTPEMEYYQKKILWANEIVFIFPYWWGSMPAILKNFIDWNFSAGFAYKYIKSRPIGLLKGKTVKIFTTTGAPKFYYNLTGANRRLRKMFKQQIINFCGLKLTDINIYGGVGTSGFNSEKVLSKIRL